MSQKYLRVWNSKTTKAWMIEVERANYLKGKKGHYLSTCYYNQDQYNKFQQNPSVAGITDVKTDQLWFDFDSHTDVNQSKSDAILLIERLQNSGFSSEAISAWYSGNKGMHVIVKLQNELNPEQVKKIVDKFKTELSTLDLQIYDANRILRAPNTQHEKTNLYKIPLTLEELKTLDLDKIKKLAENVREINQVINPTLLPKNLLVESVKEELNELFAVDENDPLKLNEIDFTQKPYGWKDYKWALAQGRFEIGGRNLAMMTIAATCRALKFDRELTEAFCLKSDRLHCEITNDSPMSDKSLQHEVLDTVFGDHWNGGQYSASNNIELQKYCVKHGFEISLNEISEIMNLHDVNASFKDFVVNIDKNTIKTGITVIDEKVPITVGMNMGIIGAASAGKTAIALEILKHTSMNGVVSVIASLDMHRNRLYEKMLYKVSEDVYKKSLSREQLYKIYQNNEDSALYEEVQKQYGNVYFYDRSRPCVNDIKQFILQVEQQTGRKVKLLMVDYFERVGSDVSDATASSLKVASELQDLINDLNLAVITLVQPNKFSLAGGPDSPILNYTAIKGSSFLYQSFRSIISIWRPFFTPKTKDLDKFMEMAILKNDLGELDSFKFNWEGKTGSITEMNDEQESIYNEYLQQKKELLKPDDFQNEQDNKYGAFRKQY